MSKLDGKEPKHWHDEDGRHRMLDPRRLAVPEPIIGRDGEPTGEMTAARSKAAACSGDPDLVAYWDHLDAHDRLKVMPEREAGDSEKVSALFDVLEHAQRQVETTAELIVALRSRGE